jgi:hypothetical protein
MVDQTEPLPTQLDPLAPCCCYKNGCYCEEPVAFLGDICDPCCVKCLGLGDY